MCARYIPNYVCVILGVMQGQYVTYKFILALASVAHRFDILEIFCSPAKITLLFGLVG